MNPSQHGTVSTATVETDSGDSFCANFDFDQVDAAAAVWFRLNPPNPLPATRTDEPIDFIDRLLDEDDDETDGAGQQADQSMDEEWSQAFAGRVEAACADAGRTVEAETAESSKFQEPAANLKRTASRNDEVVGHEVRLKSRRIALRQRGVDGVKTRQQFHRDKNGKMLQRGTADRTSRRAPRR